MFQSEITQAHEWLTAGGETPDPVRLERYRRIGELDWAAREGTLTGPERMEYDLLSGMVPRFVR